MSPASPSEASPPQQSSSVRLGRFLDRFGQLCLPLGLGLAGGYWISDRGVRWMPSMLEILSIFFLVALLLILLGQWLKGKIAREVDGASVVRKRVVVLLGLALLAVVVRLGAYWLEQPSPLTGLDESDLRTSFALDTRQYQDIDRELERLVQGIERSEIGRVDGERRGLTKAEERLLRGTWTAFYDNAFALDQIRIFYEDYYHFDLSRAERHLLVRSYMLTFAAELALYEKSLRFSRLITQNAEAHKFLDAPHPEEGLPEHTFSVFREEFQGVRDQARVLAGEQYLAFLDTTFSARELARDRGFGDLWQRIERHLATIRGVTALERADQTLRGDLQVMKRSVRRTWFPAQKAVAEWMGKVKTRRVGRYLISRQQEAEASKHMEPGDVLISRKNWHLSNVGLPGFWPHAMLYIGDPEKLQAFFDTPEVRAHVTELTGQQMSLAEYLERTYPAHWARYLSGVGGDPVEILEAIGEGVLLNSLDRATGDYLGALRPRLSTLAKAQAIIEAFSHLGKPYDYDFNFATDHALVCSEVVWRSYRPATGKDGVDLPLMEVVGRLALAPTDIARLFDEEHGREDQRFDFVYFLDAREGEQRAIVSTEEEFRKTHLRSKWDILQE